MSKLLHHMNWARWMHALPMDMLVVIFGGTRGTSRVQVGGVMMANKIQKAIEQSSYLRRDQNFIKTKG